MQMKLVAYASLNYVFRFDFYRGNSYTITYFTSVASCSGQVGEGRREKGRMKEGGRGVLGGGGSCVSLSGDVAYYRIFFFFLTACGFRFFSLFLSFSFTLTFSFRLFFLYVLFSATGN